MGRGTGDAGENREVIYSNLCRKETATAFRHGAYADAVPEKDFYLEA